MIRFSEFLTFSEFPLHYYTLNVLNVTHSDIVSVFKMEWPIRDSSHHLSGILSFIIYPLSLDDELRPIQPVALLSDDITKKYEPLNSDIPHPLSMSTLFLDDWAFSRRFIIGNNVWYLVLRVFRVFASE